MELIIFEKESYYQALAEMKKFIKEAISEIKPSASQAPIESKEQWVNAKEAEAILHCRKTKLKKLRDAALIRVYKHERKILYHKKSLLEYLEDFANKSRGTFKT